MKLHLVPTSSRSTDMKYGTRTSDLLCAKSRVVPIGDEKQTLPRLELLSSLLARRRDKWVCNRVTTIQGLTGIQTGGDIALVLEIQLTFRQEEQSLQLLRSLNCIGKDQSGWF